MICSFVVGAQLSTEPCNSVSQVASPVHVHVSQLLSSYGNEKDFDLELNKERALKAKRSFGIADISENRLLDDISSNRRLAPCLALENEASHANLDHKNKGVCSASVRRSPNQPYPRRLPLEEN